MQLRPRSMPVPSVAIVTLLLALTSAPLAGCSSGDTAAGPSTHSADGRPQEAQVVTDDGVVLQTRTLGPPAAAETLIAVHGGPGLSLEAMAPFGRLVGPDRRVVSYDQRGAGRSTSPADLDYGLAEHVADLETIRTALGAERVQLVGQSWGGAIAAAYAATHPERVSALVLVGAVPLDRAEYLAGQARFQLRVEELQAAGDIDEVIPSIDRGSCVDAFEAVLPAYLGVTPTTAPVAVTSCDADTARATYESFVADTSVEELADDLGAFRSPVLLLAGDHDVFGSDWITRIQDLFGHTSVETVLIGDAGHLVAAERPDETMSAIREFLRS